MITFIMIVSFVLHCISILAIIILYQRQNRYKETERRMNKTQRELEEILEGFILEMKEENKEIISYLATSKKPQPKSSTISKMGNATDLTKVNVEKDSLEDQGTNKTEITNKTVIPALKSVVKAYKTAQSENQLDKDKYQPPFNDIKDQLEMTIDQENKRREQRESKVVFKDALNERLNKYNHNQTPKTTEELAVEMQNSGLTIEEIAKKLNKGKTEIELLLKFNHKYNNK